jgi:putative RecB family exonuclease
MMTIYSHSRLETFKICPLKYKFSYIDKIKREEEGIEAFLGSRFHEVMERIYKDLPLRK